MKTYKLYEHTHKTGLKYVGYTQDIDQRKKGYKNGSSPWYRHLKEHGHNYTTKIIHETNDKDDLSRCAVAYSFKFRIWENPEYANQMLENGKPGQPKSKFWNKDYLKSYRGKNSSQYGLKRSKETIDKLTIASNKAWESPERRNTQSDTRKQHFNDHPEARERLSEIRKKQYLEHPEGYGTSVPVMVEGITYVSKKAAELKSGISMYLINKRIDSQNFPDYKSKQYLRNKNL